MSITMPILDSIITNDIIEIKEENKKIRTEFLQVKNDNKNLRTELKKIQTIINKMPNTHQYSSNKMEDTRYNKMLNKINIIHELYNSLYNEHKKMINYFDKRHIPKNIILNKFIELDDSLELIESALQNLNK
tara:strand:+ start:1310 stop:1705 length:396 start_codon:yes stop_codon:yes gene_type:complete